MSRRAIAVAIWFNLAFGGAPAFGGSVLVVGPGGAYADVQTAVTAAADGDIVLVKPGTYDSPTIQGKALTVVADGPGVTLSPGPSFTPLRVLQVSAGKRVVLRGLTIAGAVVGPLMIGPVLLKDNPGTIFLDRCELSGGDAGLTAIQCDDVVVSGCDVEGLSALYDPGSFSVFPSRPGLLLSKSDVFVYGSTILGGRGLDASAPIPVVSATPGAPGVLATFGQTVVSGCHIVGGDGGDGFDLSGTCFMGQSGGPALWLSSGSPTLRVADSSYVAGAPGAAPGTCSAPPPVDDVRVETGSFVKLNADVGELTVASPVRVGSPASLGVARNPGDQVFLLVSRGMNSTLQLPLGGALHLSAPVYVHPIGVTGATGALSLTAIVPSLPASIVGDDAYFQAVTCGPSGACALTGPATFTVVDASL